MSTAEPITVTVAYATPERQWLLAVTLPAGSRVRDAISGSGIGSQVPGLDPAAMPVGIFSKPSSQDAVLRDGDRVELYRPLLCDPKEIRRQRAGGKPRARPA